MTTSHIDADTLDLDHLKQEFNRFRTELAGMKGKLGDNASDALEHMSAYLNGGTLSSRIATLETELEHLAGRLKGTGKDAVVRLEQEVGARPIASLAVAFGVGVLAAQFFRRS
jgi:ElaB/YqjD/DUF883 family membrane-anchored ribosome-binding protein